MLEYSPKTRLLNILRRLAHCASQPEPAPVYVFADLHDAKRAAEARGGELAREEAVNAHGPWRSTLPCRSWGYYCRCTVDASSVIGPLDVDEATGGFGAIRGGLVSSEAWGSQRRKSEHRAALQCLCLLLLASPDVVQRAAAETSVPAKLAPVQ